MISILSRKQGSQFSSRESLDLRDFYLGKIMNDEILNNMSEDEVSIMNKELEIEKDYYNIEHDRAKILDDKANIIFGLVIGILGLSAMTNNLNITFDVKGIITVHNSISILILMCFLLCTIWFIGIFFAKDYYEMNTENGKADNYNEYIKSVLNKYREINSSNSNTNDKKANNLKRLSFSFLVLVILIFVKKVLNL